MFICKSDYSVCDNGLCPNSATPLSFLQLVQDLIKTLRELQVQSMLQANASKLAMNISLSNQSSASWLMDDSVPVIFSCFLQYCTYLWNNCQCCCSAAGWKTELFVCDWKLYLSCWGGKMGCMLTLIGEILSENTITNGCICAHVCLLVCLLTYLLGPTT